MAQAREELTPGLDPAAAAATLWAAMVGAHLQWRLDDTLDLGPVFDTLEQLYVGT